MRFSTFAKAWNDFWFKPTAPTGIALYRMMAGLLTLISGIHLAPDLLLWLGNRGVVSLETSRQFWPVPVIDLFSLLPPGDAWVVAYFVFSMVAAILLAIGLFTRASAFFVWLWLVSSYHRNPTITNAGDTLLQVGVFFLIFSQAGRALSADQWRRRSAGKETQLSPEGPPWAQRMIQIQLAVMYLADFYLKSQTADWANGTAVYYAARIDSLWGWRLPYLFEHLWTIQLCTWGVFAFELLFPILVWIREFRYFILGIGVLFHLLCNFSFNFLFLQWIILSTYVTFIEPEPLQRAWQRIRAWRNR